VEHSPDENCIMGVYLSKELPKQAGRVLEKCVRKIAPEIMTWTQYAGKYSSHSRWGCAKCPGRTRAVLEWSHDAHCGTVAK
jgi:hypothetical protein